MSGESFFILVLSFLFLLLLTLVLTLSSFQIQPTVQEQEKLVWLTRNVKLEVTKYSRQIYGPRGFTYSGGGDNDDDDGDGGASGLKTTLSYQLRKRHHE